MIVVSVSDDVRDPGSTPGRSTNLVEEMKMEKVETKLVGKAEFDAYAVGLCYASACTSLTDVAQIELNMNASNPTGISHHWKVSEDKAFKTGEANPHACHDKPATHKHYLFVC